MGAKRDLDKVLPEINQAVYSGEASNAFWRRIRRMKDKKAQAMCFELACALQDIEYRLLRAMEIAEKNIVARK